MQDPFTIFQSLLPELQAEIRGIMHLHSFQSGSVIFPQGAPGKAIHILAQGRLKIVRVTPEGHESILCIRHPGDIFCPVPLLDEGSHLGSAVAMTDIALFSAQKTEFLALCESNPALMVIVQADCIGDIRRLTLRLETLTFRSIRDRLAHTLYLHSQRLQKDAVDPYTLHMTQQELAGLVGATRESVSRNLSRLEKKGILLIKRGRIQIINPERLQAHVNAIGSTSKL